MYNELFHLNKSFQSIKILVTSDHTQEMTIVNSVFKEMTIVNSVFKD